MSAPGGVGIRGRAAGTDHAGHSLAFLIDDYPTMSHMCDDMMTGNNTSGQVGVWGMTFAVIGAGGVTRIASEAGHPGIWRMTTDSVADGNHGLFTWTGNAHHLNSETFDLLVNCRWNQINTTVRHRVGFGSSAEPPVDGMYIEKLAADTSWFGVCRASSVETRTAALLTADTSFHTFRIRRLNSSTIGFTIDRGEEALVTANIPTAVTNVIVYVETAEAVAKTLDFDLIDYLVTGMTARV